MNSYFFITGTGSGIGLSLAKLLSANPENNVFGYSRRKVDLGSNYIHQSLDLAEVSNLLEFNFPDTENPASICLINNAADLGEIARVGQQTDRLLLQTINVNLTAPMILCNRFLKQFGNNPVPKTILNITSGAATSPYDGWSVYCASKAGLDMLTQVLYQEQQFLPEKIRTRILAIAPGVVDTPMQDAIRKADKDSFSKLSKFLDLKETNSLRNPDWVAGELIKILTHPEKELQTISRL